MDQDTGLFVQAFWVKCREVIRPEVDAAVDHLRSSGDDPSVSTQEFSDVPDHLPGHAGPSLVLAVRVGDSASDAPHPTIEFHGDVRRQAIDVVTSFGGKASYEISALGVAEVRAEIDGWLQRVAAFRRV